MQGTAPYARAWIVIEHPGPWARDAVQQANLTGMPEIIRLGAAHGVRVLLMRQHRQSIQRRNVFIATPGVVRHGSVEDLIELVEMDWADLALRPPNGFDIVDDEVLLICTNGKRDRCCAIEGRSLIDSAAEDRHLWECTHLGGHRFAPVALHLQSGLCFGRLRAPDLQELRSGRVPLDRLRGSTYEHPAQQVAVGQYRRDASLTILTSPPSTLSLMHDDAAAVTIHTDGCDRTYLLERRPMPPQIESCAGAEVTSHRWHVVG